MLSGLPFLELIALAWDGWASAALPLPHFVAALRADPCGLAWSVTWLLRLLHVGTINLCMSVFGYHFMIGFFSSSRHHSFKVRGLALRLTRTLTRTRTLTLTS